MNESDVKQLIMSSALMLAERAVDVGQDKDLHILSLRDEVKADPNGDAYWKLEVTYHVAKDIVRIEGRLEGGERNPVFQGMVGPLAMLSWQSDEGGEFNFDLPSEWVRTLVSVQGAGR